MRKLANELKQRRVLKAEFRGGGCTGVPEYRIVRNPVVIGQLIKSLDFSVRRDYSRSKPVSAYTSGLGLVSGDPYPIPDKLTFFLEPLNPNNDPDQRQIDFYADIYEGTFPGMLGGAVSPAFQDTLRQLGIPSDRPKSTNHNIGTNIRIWIEDVAENFGRF